MTPSPARLTPVMRILSWLQHGLDGEVLRLAATLAYATLLAVVPLVTVMFAVLSLFPVFGQWTQLAESFIFAHFVPAAGEVISDYLQQFSAQAGRLTVIGLLTLLVTALLLLATIENALNRIWGVSQGRSAAQRILVYWTLLTLGPIMVVGSLAFSSYLVSSALLGIDRVDNGSRDLLVTMLPALLEFLTFLLIYHVVPNCVTKLVHSIVGALIATVLFETAKVGFTWYVSEFNSFEIVYGAFGVIPIFLVWIYISWLVILIGAGYAARLDAVERGKPAMAQGSAN